MPTAIVADAHLGGPGGPPTPLIEQLDGLVGRCQRLLLLGDLFHVWVGFDQFATPEIRAVAAALERLRAAGVETIYLEGNRDFFVERGPWRALFDQLGVEASFVEGGKRVLAVHGDGLDDEDRSYRRWRRLSKSAVVRWATRHLPLAVAHRLVHSTERRLAETNFKHRIEIPEAAIRRYAARRLAEGHDLLLLGHFHEPRCYPVEGGEVRIVEAWFTSRRIEWLGELPPVAEAPQTSAGEIR